MSEIEKTREELNNEQIKFIILKTTGCISFRICSLEVFKEGLNFAYNYGIEKGKKEGKEEAKKEFLDKLCNNVFILSILNDCVTVDTNENMKFICIEDVINKIKQQLKTDSPQSTKDEEVKE